MVRFVTERKSADERTADLLTAAEAILARNRRVTVSEIAREAGIASGTFYLYFPSKAHLAATLIERYVLGAVDRAEQAMADGPSWIGRFEAVVQAMVAHALDHRPVLELQVLHTPTAGTRETIAAGTDRMVSLLTQILTGGTETGEFEVDDPSMTAALVYHGVDGVLRSSVTFERELDPDRLVATLHHNVRQMLVHEIRLD